MIFAIILTNLINVYAWADKEPNNKDHGLPKREQIPVFCTLEKVDHPKHVGDQVLWKVSESH